jgi:hypothetical protein
VSAQRSRLYHSHPGVTLGAQASMLLNQVDQGSEELVHKLFPVIHIVLVPIPAGKPRTRGHAPAQADINTGDPHRATAEKQLGRLGTVRTNSRSSEVTRGRGRKRIIRKTLTFEGVQGEPSVQGYGLTTLPGVLPRAGPRCSGGSE